MKVGELFIALGFKADNASLKEFNDKISEAQKNLVRIGAGATAAVYGVNRFLNSSVKSAEAMRNYREQTGFATEGLLKFARVAERVNTNVRREDVIQTYSNIADAIGQATRGNLPEGGLWTSLADSLYGSTPDEFLNKLREKIPELLSQYEREGGGGRSLLLSDLEGLGISRDIAQAYLATQEKWDAASKDMRVRTREEEAALESLAQTYVKLRHAYEDFSWAMSVKIAPHFEKFVEFVTASGLPMLEEFAYQVTIAAKELFEAFQGFDGTTQSGIIGFLWLVFMRLSPLATLLTTVVAGLNEFGKWRLGKENVFSDINKWAQETEGIVAGVVRGIINALKMLGVLQNIQKGGSGYTEVPADYGLGGTAAPWAYQTGFERYLDRTNLNHNSSLDKIFIENQMRQQGTAAKAIEQTNNVNLNLQTTADARETAALMDLTLSNTLRNLTWDTLTGAQGNITSSAFANPSLLRTP